MFYIFMNELRYKNGGVSIMFYDYGKCRSVGIFKTSCWVNKGSMAKNSINVKIKDQRVKR